MSTLTRGTWRAWPHFLPSSMGISRLGGSEPVARQGGTVEAVVAAWVALGCFAVLFKILKIGRAYLSWFDPWVVARVAVGGIVGALVVLGVLMIFLRKRHDTHRGIQLVVPLLAAVLLLEGVVALATGSFELMTIRGIGITAWDLGFFAVALCLILSLGSIHHRAAVALTVLLCPVLLLLYSLEAAFFLRTGTQGNWLLVKFLILSYDVKGAVLEDIDWLQSAWIVVPQLVLAGSVILSRRWLTRDAAPARWRRTAGRFGLLGLALVAVGLVFPVRWLPPSYQPHSGSLAATLLRDSVIGQPLTESAELELELPDYSSATLVAADGQPRNVVMIVLESTRAFSAPPLNADGLWMPFLDSLASESLVVERMYTTVPYTSEALLALFGGTVPPFSRLTSYANDVRTGWPDLLRSAGYETAFFTATYLNKKREERRMLERLGFTTIVAAEDLAENTAAVATYSGFEDFVILDPMQTWIDSVLSADGRFAVACLTQSSHHPYELPPAYDLQPSGKDDKELHQYLNTLTYADGFLAAVYRGLERRGLLDSTVLVVVGDHGESFGEHGARFHGMNVWEEGVRVPFIVHDPAGGRAGTVTGPFQQIDILPTVVELAGFELRSEYHPPYSILNGRIRDRVFIASAGSQAMALVVDSLKYVYHYRRRPTQVFNVLSDPLEEHDIAHRFDDEHLRDVEMELLLWQRAVNK